MNTSPFRSHLMQQFYSVARTQSRPPLVLATTFKGRNNANNDVQGTTSSDHRRQASSTTLASSSHALEFHQCQDSLSRSFATVVDASSGAKTDGPSVAAQSMQQLITSRRTVSNFLPHPPSSSLSIETTIPSSQRVLQDAIQRGVECAMSAPNHKITEPTTFHQILTPSAASERLLDISYEATYQRLLLNKLSGVDACRNEAIRKRDKWGNVPAFLVAAVGGMEDQYNPETEDVRSPYEELPPIPPRSIQQLEDYASSCASIQNLLLSLHSEGLASKWSTAPIIRTAALRELVGCGKNDMIVGLIMIGWSKRVPRMPRRRRDRDGDVLKDVVV